MEVDPLHSTQVPAKKMQKMHTTAKRASIFEKMMFFENFESFSLNKNGIF